MSVKVAVEAEAKSMVKAKAVMPGVSVAPAGPA
jgi:hypothetical protein